MAASIRGRASFLAADRQIDPRTGTIRISASFPNPKHTLRPGQYGRVGAETQVLKNALLVPQRAVSELQGASQLRVVGEGDKVVLRSVTLGARVGNRFIVTDGLEPNARVIVDARSFARAPSSRPDRIRSRRKRSHANGVRLMALARRFHPDRPRQRLLSGATAGIGAPRSAAEAGGGAVIMAAFFVRRPIVAIVIAIVTVLAGLVSMQALPIAQFPNIVPPQIIVTGTYTGADAVTIEQSVATPLEQQVNGVDDMLYMQSTNGNDGIDAADRHVRHRHRSEHRSGERAEPRGAGAAEPADRRHAVRPHHAQGRRACR